jgi:hypothetical protein
LLFVHCVFACSVRRQTNEERNGETEQKSEQGTVRTFDKSDTESTDKHESHADLQPRVLDEEQTQKQNDSDKLHAFTLS